MKQETVDQITKIVSEKVLEYLDKEKERRQKQKRDWRLRNTKLLLKNYQGFIAHVEDIEDDLSILQSAEVLEELYTEEFAIESIKRSKQRTLTMVRFIERMLFTYRIMCESSHHPEDLRRYKIIDAMYISGDNQTAEKIAECHNIEVRTVYRDVNDACKVLSVLIFGVDGIHFG